jgi:membrane protease subunit (stomatin/prohibitin family)
VKWGTTNPIPLLDPVYKVALPVRAFGQFAIRVADSRQVFTQLSAQRGEFTIAALQELYKGALMSRIKDYISRTIVDGKITLLEVSAKLDSISDGIKGKLAPDFAKFGVELVNFFVASIDVPDEDPSVQKLKAALAQKAELDILGAGYDKKRTFDVLEKAAGNEGAGGGMAAMGVGLGMGAGAGMGIGGMMANAMGSVNKGAAGKCAKCGKDMAADAKFCSGCGEKVAA